MAEPAANPTPAFFRNERRFTKISSIGWLVVPACFAGCICSRPPPESKAFCTNACKTTIGCEGAVPHSPDPDSSYSSFGITSRRATIPSRALEGAG